MSPSNRKAFSLLELSIVIIVIGILIAGTLQGRDLINKAKVKTARNLTLSSPVAGINSLVVWYETTLEESVSFNESENVTSWNDINPQSLSKINATPDSGAFTGYNDNAIDGLPAMYFDGTSHGFNIAALPLAGSDVTFFIVEQHDQGALNGTHNGIISQMGDAAEFIIAYSNQKLQYYYYAYKAYSSNDIILGGPQILIHSLIFKYNEYGGFEYYQNGVEQTISPSHHTGNSQVVATAPNYVNLKIGYKSRGAFTGNIFEIIAFNRDLKNSERSSIEDYLIQKYGVY